MGEKRKLIPDYGICTKKRFTEKMGYVIGYRNIPSKFMNSEHCMHCMYLYTDSKKQKNQQIQ